MWICGYADFQMCKMQMRTQYYKLQFISLHFIEIFLVGIALLLSIYIYKGELNSTISSTAANRIVARLHVNTVLPEHENVRGLMSIAAF